MQSRQLLLYVLVLILASFVVLSAMGGGLFQQDAHWLVQWQHQMFDTLCHQESNRSFWINDQPMAVCSRCFGIYSSFWIGWLLLPVIPYIDYISLGKAKKLLGVLVLINLVDVVGNLLGFWQNTLYSRLLLGLLTGGAAVFLFSGDFYINKNKTNRDQYGTVTTSDVGK